MDVVVAMHDRLEDTSADDLVGMEFEAVSLIGPSSVVISILCPRLPASFTCTFRPSIAGVDVDGHPYQEIYEGPPQTSESAWRANPLSRKRPRRRRSPARSTASSTPVSTTQYPVDPWQTLREVGYSEADMERLRTSNPDLLYAKSEKEHFEVLADHVERHVRRVGASKPPLEELLNLRRQEAVAQRAAEDDLHDTWMRWFGYSLAHSIPTEEAQKYRRAFDFDYVTLCHILTQWLQEACPAAFSSRPSTAPVDDATAGPARNSRNLPTPPSSFTEPRRRSKRIAKRPKITYTAPTSAKRRRDVSDQTQNDQASAPRRQAQAPVQEAVIRESRRTKKRKT